MYSSDASGSPGSRDSRLSSDSDFRISLFIFFAPLVCLALEVVVSGGGKPFFATGIFLAGTLLELLLDGLLRRRAAQERITRSRWLSLQYLNRTVLGLPLTIYLASAAISPATALFRLLPVVYLLCQSRQRSQPILHLILYLIGFFLYVAGLRYSWPGEREWLQAATGFGLGALVLWREHLGAKRTLVAARLRRELSRRTRAYRHVAARESRLLDAILVTPERVRRYRDDRAIAPVAGDMLCVAVAFFDPHQAVYDLVRRAREERGNAEAALQEFEHEWDLCVDQYRTKFAQAGCLLIVGDRLIYAIDSNFASGKFDGAPGSERVAQERLLELIFVVRSLLAFTGRSRRALEGRGRVGWSAQAAVAHGFGALVRRGPENPGIVGRGPVFRAVEGQLFAAARGADAAGSFGDGQARLLPATEKIYVQSALAEPVRRAFQGEESGENWFSPGLLQATFSTGGEGLEPVPDFFERLRYGA